MSSSANSLLVGILSFLAVAAGEGGHTTIKLSDFQRVLQSSLDNELAKLADQNNNVAANLPNQRNLHSKRKSNMRRKASNVDVDDVQSLQESSDGMSSFSTEGMWVNLIEHSWNAAQTIKRDERLSITSNPEETQPTPFLICTPRGLRHNGIDTVQSILGTFDKHYDSVVVSSSLDETCIVVTTTALQARQALDKDQTLVTMPLIDISKIHSGTIDEVSSQGWSVPYHQPKESSQQERKNETESMNNWERIISVDFVPGLGGMKEESQILKVVNDMMGDIQDMAEVGWLRSIGKEEAEQYMIAESLVGVPALSDLFSLTSTSVTKVTGDEGNTRVAFWHDAFKNGIQAEHACSDMFSTLFVKPRAGYFGYDLVLNPSDGPPPQEYISSASNPACVTSYLAALSTHPYVLSVKANFPIYHGWHVAQKLDAAKK